MCIISGIPKIVLFWFEHFRFLTLFEMKHFSELKFEKNVFKSSEISNLDDFKLSLPLLLPRFFRAGNSLEIKQSCLPSLPFSKN